MSKFEFTPNSQNINKNFEITANRIIDSNISRNRIFAYKNYDGFVLFTENKNVMSTFEIFSVEKDRDKIIQILIESMQEGYAY